MAMPKINQSPSNSGSPISGEGYNVTSPPTRSESGSTSAQMLNPAGSGSRPVSSRYPIPTSAPADAYTLGRAPAGYLKQTR